MITKHCKRQQYQWTCCIAIRIMTQQPIPTKYIMVVSGIDMDYDRKASQKSTPFWWEGVWSSTQIPLHSLTCLSAIHESSITMAWTFTVTENPWKTVYFSPFHHQRYQKTSKNIGVSQHLQPLPPCVNALLALAPALGFAIQLKATGMQPTSSHGNGWTKAYRWLQRFSSWGLGIGCHVWLMYYLHFI